MKKNRKVETVSIEIPDVVREKPVQGNDDNSYYVEVAVEKENVHTLYGFNTIESKVKKINHDFEEFAKMKTDILQWYYIFKIFSPSVVKNDKYNNKKIALDRGVNNLKRLYENISRRIRKLDGDDDLTEQYLEEVFSSLNNLFDFGKNISKDQDSFRNSYYKDLKLSSITICKNKSVEDLDRTSKEVEEFIINYGDLWKSNDYVFYNSGNLITDVVDQLVKCIEDTGNEKAISNYNHQYFLTTDVVITMSLNEWISLFNRIRFVHKMLEGINEINLLRLDKRIRELEIRYIVLLIANEADVKRSRI